MRAQPPSGKILLLLVLTLAACDTGVERRDSVTPAAGTPQELVKEGDFEVWHVGWDNPVVTGLFELPPTGFAVRNSEEAWEYNKFDLELDIEQDGSRKRIYTWPISVGTFGSDESSFWWESHGIALQPRVTGTPLEAISTVQAIRDDWNAAEYSYKKSGRIELDPETLLVPLRMIALHVAGRDPIAEQDLDVLFDDLWFGAKGTNTNPDTGAFPDNVVTPWLFKSDCIGPSCSRFAFTEIDPEGRQPILPDRVFDQCNIQFRKVSYVACEIPESVYYNLDAPELNGCNEDLQRAAIKNAILNCEGLPDDNVPRVYFTGTLIRTGSCLEGGSVPVSVPGLTYQREVFITELATSDLAHSYVISHELGHLAGLDHVACGDGQRHLMCELAHHQNRNMGGENDCNRARLNAATFQGEYWH